MASVEDIISEPDHPLDETDTQGEPKCYRMTA